MQCHVVTPVKTGEKCFINQAHVQQEPSYSAVIEFARQLWGTNKAVQHTPGALCFEIPGAASPGDIVMLSPMPNGMCATQFWEIHAFKKHAQSAFKGGAPGRAAGSVLHSPGQDPQAPPSFSRHAHALKRLHGAAG